VIALHASRAGGAEVYTVGLVRTLAARGHRVTLICHEADVDLGPGVEVRIVPRPAYDQLPVLWRLRPLLLMRSAVRELRRLRLDPPDVVIGSAQQLTWAHGRVFPSTPLIYMGHATIAPLFVDASPVGSGLQRRIAVGLSRALERRAINRAVRTLRFSRTACEAMEAYYGAAIQPRFEVVPAPVDLPGASASAAPGTHTPPRLLYLGRLAETKNVHLLIDALGELSGLPWHLDIVGAGEERPRIEQLIARHGLNDRITLHGQQDDVPRFYREADLFVFPSRMENFSLALLEAMSYGLPALTIQRDGGRFQNAHHEFIRDGENGFLVNGEDGFRTRLRALLTDPAVSSTLATVGHGARAYVEARHVWPVHAAQLEAVFDEVCATHAPRPTTAPQHLHA